MDTLLFRPWLRLLAVPAAALLLAACSNLSQTLRDGEVSPPARAGLKPVQKAETAPLLSKEDLALLEVNGNMPWRPELEDRSDRLRQAQQEPGQQRQHGGASEHGIVLPWNVSHTTQRVSPPGGFRPPGRG